MVQVWRRVVKGQMRKLDISDLHDYYDFNVNIEEKVERIRRRILNGRYRSGKPLVYKTEKKLGISRHLLIPSPSDALVFQTIANYLAKDLENKQPSQQAYFSQNRHNLKLPHEIVVDSSELWLELWVKFQKEIYEFSNSYKFLVVTDLANYFDNIDLRQLRNVISNYFEVEEVVLDVLFKIIEEISWVPDYLPNTSIGLPTINIEAPRLLAHILLFEVDNILMQKTDGSFVRWMDDINFGVDDIELGKEILGDINDVLKSRGLALNLSKTKIFTASEAEEHYLFNENIYLDELTNTIEEGEYIKGELAKEIEKDFKAHLKRKDLKNWSKVTKRFFTAAGKIRTTRLLKFSDSLFYKYPGLRGNILYYIYSLGYTKATQNILIKLLENTPRHDDVTLFMLVNTLTNLNLPVNKETKEFIRKVEVILLEYSEKSSFEFFCYLWFGSKYSDPDSLYNFIMKNKRKWSNDDFLARQVVSILPKIYLSQPVRVENLLTEQIDKGASDVTSVAINIKSFFQLESYPKGMNFYLFPSKKQSIYPLPKFLMLIAVMQSKHFKNDKAFHSKILTHVNDPWYLYWIKNNSPIE